MPDITIQLVVDIPKSSAGAFARAMTDDDNDVLLAAERAIRQRLDVDEIEQVELSFSDDERLVKEELEEIGREQP